MTRTALLSAVCLLFVAGGCKKHKANRADEGSGCPEAGERVGGTPPAAFERWCQVEDADGSFVRHGPYRRWHQNGRKAEDVTYRRGKRVGLGRYWTTGGERRSAAEVLIPGCWKIDFDEMLATNRIDDGMAPARFEELVLAHTYRFAAGALDVHFRPTTPDERGGAFHVAFDVKTLFDGDEATIRVGSQTRHARGTGLQHGMGLCPPPAKVVAKPPTHPETDGAAVWEKGNPSQYRACQPPGKPYVIRLKLRDGDTMTSPANFLLRFLWGQATGPLRLRRSVCPPGHR